jgi:hypothetical protein
MGKPTLKQKSRGRYGKTLVQAKKRIMTHIVLEELISRRFI